MFYERRWPEMTHLLARARALLGPDGAEVRTRASLLLLAATMARVHGDAEATAAYSAETLEVMSHSGVEDPSGAAYRAIAQNNLGSGQLWSGQVTAAEASLRAALPLTRVEGRIEVSEINALSHLGFASVTSGRVTEGVELAEEASGLVQRRGWARCPRSRRLTSPWRWGPATR